MEKELVKMSQKGQLVVPEDIRKMEGFDTGDRFVSFPIKDGVLFKKVRIPDVKIEFEKLSKEIEAQFRRKGVSKRDVREAVKWARKR